ncbi:MAG: ABC transporter ATP-binding protein [Chloroflexi bacterium]|nr:ABC transporter ATP-binding protein [Chloroflexota bacterium]
MASPGMVDVRGLTKRYGDTCALEDVSLSVAPGEWLVVMGPSGSGKTTFLNIVGCLDQPTEGIVTVDGKDVSHLSPREMGRFRRETIGLIFQQFHLIPYLNSLENVMLAQYFHSMADEAEARDALVRVGLGDRLRHLPSQLSGGEQQRVCIARALINSPKILLADEPSGNLDRRNEEMVMGLLSQRHREGYTLIMVTHNPEIAQLADRLVNFDHGHLVSEKRNHLGQATLQRPG